MTFTDTLHKVTSFASMIINGNRIRNIVGQTGEEYLGTTVYETQPNGTQLEAIIMNIEWQPSIGLNGEWCIFIAYTDEKSPVVGHWCGRDVLTLKEGE